MLKINDIIKKNYSESHSNQHSFPLTERSNYI